MTKSKRQIEANTSHEHNALEQALLQLASVEHQQKELQRQIAQLRENIQTLMVERKENVETFNWEEQYESAIETLRKFEFLSCPPNLTAVQRSFTLEKRNAISKLKGPVLLLVPNNSFLEKISMINDSNLLKARIKVSDGFYMPNDTERKQITAWQAVIIEGEGEMDLEIYDNDRHSLGRRIKKRREIKRNSGTQNLLEGTDRHNYALLQMHALSTGNPIDQDTSTILDGDEALNGDFVTAIPVVNYHKIFPELFFSKYNASNSWGSGRFRSVVKGEEIDTKRY